MTTVVNQTRGRPRPKAGLRLTVFAVLLAVVVIGGDPMPAAGEEAGVPGSEDARGSRSSAEADGVV